MRVILILLALCTSVLGQQPTGLVRVYCYQDEDNSIDNYGSGTVISPTRVLTNWHVVKKCRETNPIQIRLFNNQRVAASIKSYAVIWDMALLETTSVLHVKPFETGDRPVPGMLATIHGLGTDYEYSTLAGVVSRTFRYPPVLTEEDCDFFVVKGALARPGDSGGPVLNLQGKLIGVLHATRNREGSTQGITIDRIIKEFDLENQ